MIGDEAELYRTLSPRVQRSVRHQVKTSPENVEDACHFAWVAFLRHTEKVRRETALTWLTTTALHEAYKLIARQKRTDSLEQTLETRPQPAASVSADEPAERASQREQIALVRQLPKRQQKIVWLQAAGLSHAQIAAATGDTARTVQRQLYRARHTLTQLRPPNTNPHHTTAITTSTRPPARGLTRPPTAL